MNAAVPPLLSPPLSTALFGWLAPDALAPDVPAEAHWLAAQAHERPLACAALNDTLALWHRAPPAQDQPLHQLCQDLALNDSECMALALCLAADADVVASRALAWLQAPLRDAFPTPGLIACLDAQRGLSAALSLSALLDGVALACGLLQWEAGTRALPDARLRLPTPLVLALTGGQGRFPGVQLDARDGAPLAPSVLAQAAHQAQRLAPGEALVVRCGHPREARAACAAIARGLGLRAAFVEGEAPPGLLPWLLLQRALPVWVAELSPGERRRVPPLHGALLPQLVASGPEGSWTWDGQTVPVWTVPVPPADERAALWRDAGLSPEAAGRLARHHRHASARIAELAHAAHSLCRGEPAAQVDAPHVARAARSAGQDALGSLARLMPDDVPDNALVLPPALRHDLGALV